MGLPRSTYYAAPKGPPPDEALVAEMQAITDEFECYGYRRGVVPSCATAAPWWSMPRRCAG